MCAPLSDELREYLRNELEDTGYCRICHNTRAYGDLGAPCPFCQPEAAEKVVNYVVIPAMIVGAVLLVVIVVVGIVALT